MKAVVALIFLLAACAPIAEPIKPGRIVSGATKQDVEQCRAQPDLAWCHGIAR